MNWSTVHLEIIFYSAHLFQDFVVTAIFQNRLNSKEKYLTFLHIKKNKKHIAFTACFCHQKSFLFASSDQRILFLVVWESFRGLLANTFWPPCHTGLTAGLLEVLLSPQRNPGALTKWSSSSRAPPWLRSFYPDPSGTASSRKTPGGPEPLPLTHNGGHCALWDLQSSRDVSVPSPDLCLLGLCSDVHCLLPTLKLPQVDSKTLR